MNNNQVNIFILISAIIIVDNINGHVAFIKDYPHHVAILYKNNSRCGGSIISKNFILTTAQCIFNLSAKSLQIKTGSNFSNKNGSLYFVKHIRIHPDFQEVSLDFDLGLLEVDGDILYSESSRHIDLSEDSFEMDLNKCHVLAWNTKTNNIEVSNVTIINQNYCQDIYLTRDALITNRMLCVQFTGEFVCESDIGGSLICSGNQLTGMRSWGYGCNFQDYPEVLTNLFTLKDFIRSTLNYYNEISC